MLKKKAARPILTVLALSVFLAAGTPVFADSTDAIDSWVIESPQKPTEAWDSPGRLDENHVTDAFYNALRGLPSNLKFPNQRSQEKALASGKLKIFADGRVLDHFTKHGIAVADRAHTHKADPQELAWQGPTRPITEADYLGHHGPRLNDPQIGGMVQLGAIGEFGHIALINSNNAAYKPIAKNIAHQLAEIGSAAGLKDVTEDFRTVENGADGEKGGTSALTDKYDQALLRLDRYVAENFGYDGLWYYTLGADSVGLWWLGLGDDRFNGPTYYALMDNLIKHQPRQQPKVAALIRFQDLENYTIDNHSWHNDRYYDYYVDRVPGECFKVLAAYFPH